MSNLNSCNDLNTKMDKSSSSSVSSFVESPMSSTILLRDLREGDCYCWSVSSQSEIIDDLMPEPLSLRKQKPKEQGMSRLTTSNLTMMAQEQTLQRLPPHPTNQQNQWNYYLHDQYPEQDPVAFRSLEHIPLHLMPDHGERLTSIRQCRFLDQTKAEKISQWVEYPAPAKRELMPQWAGHEVSAIQATLRAVLGERYEPLDQFVEEALQSGTVGDDGDSRSETDGDGLDWLGDVTDLLYLARKEW